MRIKWPRYRLSTGEIGSGTGSKSWKRLQNGALRLKKGGGSSCRSWQRLQHGARCPGPSVSVWDTWYPPPSTYPPLPSPTNWARMFANHACLPASSNISWVLHKNMYFLAGKNRYYEPMCELICSRFYTTPGGSLRLTMGMGGGWEWGGVGWHLQVDSFNIDQVEVFAADLKTWIIYLYCQKVCAMPESFGGFRGSNPGPLAP